MPLRLGAGTELLVILLLVWSALAAYSFSPRALSVLGHPLEQAEIASFFEKPPARELIRGRASPNGERAPRASGASANEAGAPAAPRVADETPQRILILGDSMIEGLLPRLAEYAVENGDSVNAVIWYGSRTIDWAKGSRLSDALTAYRPTFVIYVVGSSELFSRDVEKRAPALERMVKLVGERKLLWVGPPNWAKDTGINALIEQSVGSERYFRSADLSFERKKDGIHPTLASSQRWMDAIAQFIVEQSATPIKLATPTKTGVPRPSIQVYPPPTR